MGKIKPVKVTFKKEPRNTGLYAVGNPYSETQMKINKKSFGIIHPPSWNSKNNGWIIMVRVIKKDIMEDGNKNCAWKWITFKQEFEKEELGRIWIQEHIESILSKYELSFWEGD